MPAYRRVDARQAGAAALGILVPPGPRTIVILRPRALEWDLLPLEPGKEQMRPAYFCAFSRDEAAAVARHVQEALARGAGHDPNPVEIVCSAPGQRYGVCARLGRYLWIACRRAAGQAYEPTFCPSLEEAGALAVRLTPLLWPQADAGQEYYFNTQAFSR
jgi:hypothetical protein